jgi:hypothetical protein
LRGLTVDAVNVAWSGEGSRHSLDPIALVEVRAGVWLTPGVGPLWPNFGPPRTFWGLQQAEQAIGQGGAARSIAWRGCLAYRRGFSCQPGNAVVREPARSAAAFPAVAKMQMN